MLTNFLYALRKRWSVLKGAAPLRRWLTFHIFAGFLSPAVIAFHSAFQSKNHLATGTVASLAVVVATGVLGRFVYGLVPTQEGHAVALADLAGRLERLKAVAKPMVANLPKARRAIESLDEDTPNPRSTGLLLLFWRMPWVALRRLLRLRQIRRLFPNRARYREFKNVYLDLANLRTEVAFYASLRRLLSGWRVFHVLLAILLVIMIAAHIAVSLFLGYRWLFSANA